AGHQRIAFVGGRSEVETGSERQEGYLAAVEQAGLDRIVVSGGFRRDAARVAVRELLGRPCPPSALVVANNLMALGALQAVRDRGLRVPDDISVIAVDNPDWARAAPPPPARAGPADPPDGHPGRRAADPAGRGGGVRTGPPGPPA